uniref:SMODS and SLOG-associating 2TM effector domain-containing protein n=1 Tax=viral metagenome TaxID=1070528 RepID=A0A6C0C7F7_9ZZZZ
MSNDSKKDNKLKGCVINTPNTSEDPDMCLNIKCVADLIKHIKDKKRKLDLYRKILELKYNRYKKCHNFWSISTILLASGLTLVESCKLIFLDDDNNDRVSHDFFDLSPIFLSTVITCSSSILKFKKYQEKMELYNNVIEKCVNMISKLKNKKELLELQKNCFNDELLESLLTSYNEEILSEYCIIYQESQKYIKNTDYDKYSRILNYSELHKYVIEKERLLFYEKYKAKIDVDDIVKKSNNCVMNKLCCCC